MTEYSRDGGPFNNFGARFSKSATLYCMCNKRYISTDFGDIHIVEKGEGHPVLLVHGLFVSSHTFDLLMERSPEGMHLIAVDLPGFGDSKPAPSYRPSWQAMVQCVIRIADTLDLNKFDLIGHSMGGGIAIRTAAALGKRVRKLVLIDAVSYPFSLPFKGRLFLIPLLGNLFFRLFDRKLFVAYFENDVFLDTSKMDKKKVLAHYENLCAQRKAALACVRETADPTWVSEGVKDIEAHTLVLWGEKDTLVPLHISKLLMSNLAKADCEVIADCGHSPIEEQPDKAAAIIFSFLSKEGTLTFRS